ncbi:hypothetical protein L1887_42328 [Cichorium endivia]|nr:hypothetical protein L1887_42328 [Cichorium endivia]
MLGQQRHQHRRHDRARRTRRRDMRRHQSGKAKARLRIVREREIGARRVEVRAHGRLVPRMALEMRMLRLLEEVDERGIVERAEPRDEAKRLEPRPDRLGAHGHGSPVVDANLGRIRAQLEKVVDKSHDGRQRPHDGPERNVAKLRRHLCVVAKQIVRRKLQLLAHARDEAPLRLLPATVRRAGLERSCVARGRGGGRRRVLALRLALRRAVGVLLGGALLAPLGKLAHEHGQRELGEGIDKLAGDADGEELGVHAVRIDVEVDALWADVARADSLLDRVAEEAALHHGLHDRLAKGDVDVGGEGERAVGGDGLHGKALERERVVVRLCAVVVLPLCDGDGGGLPGGDDLGHGDDEQRGGDEGHRLLEWTVVELRDENLDDKHERHGSRQHRGEEGDDGERKDDAKFAAPPLKDFLRFFGGWIDARGSRHKVVAPAVDLGDAEGAPAHGELALLHAPQLDKEAGPRDEAERVDGREGSTEEPEGEAEQCGGCERLEVEVEEAKVERHVLAKVFADRVEVCEADAREELGGRGVRPARHPCGIVRGVVDGAHVDEVRKFFEAEPETSARGDLRASASILDGVRSEAGQREERVDETETRGGREVERRRLLLFR